jgi:hypothetical protein
MHVHTTHACGWPVDNWKQNYNIKNTKYNTVLTRLRYVMYVGASHISRHANYTAQSQRWCFYLPGRIHLGKWRTSQSFFFFFAQGYNDKSAGSAVTICCTSHGSWIHFLKKPLGWIGSHTHACSSCIQHMRCIALHGPLQELASSKSKHQLT